MRALMCVLVAAALFQMPSAILLAQSRRGDMELIERHRRVPGAPVVSSWEDGVRPQGPDSLSFRVRSWSFSSDSASGNEDDAEVVVAVHGGWAYADGVPSEVMLSPCGDLLSAVSSFISMNSRGLGVAFGRYTWWRERFEDVFVSYGIPEDVALLCVVESAVVQDAVSEAGAVGMWQLMSYTAADYGLECGMRIDERLDVDRATVTAARFLSDAYRRLGSWPLAVTAYNCGVERVERAVARAGGSRDFWDIRQYLPAETRAYTPVFNAVVLAWRFADRYGIGIVPYDPGTVEFRVDWDMPFRQLQAATGITWDEFSGCNPQYLSGTVPGAQRVRSIALPRRYAKLYRDNIKVVDF